MPAQIAVHQKWSMKSPQCVVCSVIQAVSHSISALTTMWNSPSVRMYSGIDMSCTIGFTTALTSPNTTATTKMIPARARVVSPPTNSMPDTSCVTTHNATPVTAARSRKLPTR